MREAKALIETEELLQVLHVDDESDFADLTATFLEREDDQFTVETATTAEDGLERIDDRQPDCVVSDYNMPGMNGLEFLQAVRERYPDLPFVLFTGKGSEAIASDAISAGVTDYLQKRSGTEQYELLANRIRNAVDTRREAKRADRQEQLMRLTEFAGDTGGFELDVDSGTLLLTDGVRRLVGLPEDAHLNLEEAIELYHPDDQADVRQTLNQTVETGEQSRGTWRLQTLDDDERLVDVTMTPATEGDEVTTLRGAVHDITDRKQRKRELRAERRFIEQALDTLDDLFYVLDTDGTLRRWNDRASGVADYTDRDLDDMNVIELFPEDERETIAGAIETTLADGRATVEADLRTADGERRPYEFTGAQLTDEDGTVTGLVGVGRDLTGRRQRERRFQALVEESNDIISIVDTDGVFQYQSPSIEHILGYDPGETIGDPAWEYVHPDDRSALIEAFERGIENPNANPVVDYRARHADGSWRWLEARGNNQLDNRAVKGYIVNSRDVSGRKERDRELERTRDLMSDMEQLADIGAWEYDPETETTMMTDGTRRMHGLDPGTDLSLEEAFERFHPGDRGRLTDRFTECLETGEPYEVDARLATAGDTQRWVRARGERVDGSGSGRVVRGYVRDITDQKTRERQLTELNRVSEEVVTAETRQDVADIGVRAAKDILDLGPTAVHLLGAEDEQLLPVARTNELTSILDEVPALPVADSIAGRAYQRGEPVVTEDARQDPDVYDQGTDRRGHVYLPLGDHGVLIASSEEPAAFDEEDLALGELLAGTLAAAFDRIEREQAARGRQEQLSLFFDESPLGAIQWDEEFRFERMNDRAEEILGYSEAELRGEPWERIVADDDRERVDDAVESLLDADGGRRVINDNVRNGGETVTCEWHNRTVTEENGDVQSVFSKFRDVTDRTERRQELEKHETIIEALTDAVYVLDEEGRFRFVSDDLVELVGYDRETILGSTPSLIKDEDAVERAEHHLGRLLSSDGLETVQFEVAIQPYDGDPIVCEDHIGVLPYEGDEFDGSVGTLRDITERKERARELERQNARLEEFAGIVSHDLRNPLMTAQGRLELAQADCNSPHLDAVGDAVDRCQALIDDLLSLARSGDSVGPTEPVTLSELAEECWQTTPSADATFAVETEQTISADRSRLQQLFENLYRNAVNHGGSEVTVTVGEIADGFYVADDGAGIPDEDRDDIFEVGYSTADGGTGFGLAIVKEIVEAHGWEIRVTDSETGGARFEVTGIDTTH